MSSFRLFRLIATCSSSPKEISGNARYSRAVQQDAEVYACGAQSHENGQGPKGTGTNTYGQTKTGAAAATVTTS